MFHSPAGARLVHHTPAISDKHSHTRFFDAVAMALRSLSEVPNTPFPFPPIVTRATRDALCALEDIAAREMGMDVFLLTDCLINTKGRDLSAYPKGDFAALNAYLDRLTNRS